MGVMIFKSNNNKVKIIRMEIPDELHEAFRAYKKKTRSPYQMTAIYEQALFEGLNQLNYEHNKVN